jgi:hypothetical protein
MIAITIRQFYRAKDVPTSQGFGYYHLVDPDIMSPGDSQQKAPQLEFYLGSCDSSLRQKVDPFCGRGIEEGAFIRQKIARY